MGQPTGIGPVVDHRLGPEMDDRPMDALTAIRTRRSLGKVRPEMPPRAAIERIIEAATWAPNHRLTEPWRFFVLTGTAREALGDVMARSRVAGPRGEGDAAAEAERARRKPLRAPVVIAVAVEPASGAKVVEIEEIAAGSAAIQNMLLAAHALGLATMWRTGDAAYDPAVKEYLDLAPTAHLLGFVYVGYAAMDPPARTRRPAADVTRWLGWDE